VPSANTGDWFSLGITCKSAKLHSAAFDRVSKIHHRRHPRTGAPKPRSAPAIRCWGEVLEGDGRNAAVDVSSALPIRFGYMSGTSSALQDYVDRAMES